MQKLYALLHGIARLILEPCVLLQQLGKMWRNGQGTASEDRMFKTEIVFKRKKRRLFFKRKERKK